MMNVCHPPGTSPVVDGRVDFKKAPTGQEATAARPREREERERERDVASAKNKLLTYGRRHFFSARLSNPPRGHFIGSNEKKGKKLAR